MPHSIDHQGLYEFVPEAEDFVLVEAGDAAAVAPGQGIGLQYTVGAGKRAVAVKESIFLDGVCLDATDVAHEPGESQLFVWDFEEEVAPGRYRFVVDFVAGGAPLVAEIVVRRGAAPVEVEGPVKRVHTGGFSIDPDDGSLRPLHAGLVLPRDPSLVSVGASVDVEGGWPAGQRMTVLMTVSTPDGERNVVPCLLTGPRALTWPIDADGAYVVTLSFPRNPAAADQALRFRVG